MSRTPDTPRGGHAARTLRGIGLLLLTLPGVMAQTGCGGGDRADDQLGELRDRGVVRVAVADEPPFGSVTQDGTVTGLGPEVARAAFARLGVPRAAGEFTSFDELIGDVRRGRADVIGAMMTITPERCRQVAFASPVLLAPTALAVRRRERRPLVDYRSLRRADATLAVLAGAIELSDATAGGIERSRIREFPDVASAQAALELGRVDAIALTAPSIRRIAGASKGTLRPQPSFFPRINGQIVLRYGAHAFAPADTGLRDQFDRAVEELRTSGALERIALAQGFTATEVSGTRGIGWEDACDQ